MGAISIAEDNKRRWLPLHFIVTLPDVSVELIRKVLDLYPQAAREVDGNGKTPLHLIVESNKDWECIEAVFSAYPDAINAEDARGKVPLIAAALFICDGSDDMRSSSASSERERDALVIESLSLEPNASSFDGSSTLQYIQGSSSTMSNTPIHIGNEVLPPQSCDAERSNPRSREQSLSELNVLYNLLRAAPHILS